MLCLNLTSMHWCPPTLPFCPFCVCEGNCVAFCWDVCVSTPLVVPTEGVFVCLFALASTRLCAFAILSQKCLCVRLTQQILCGILVVVCVVWEMVDLGTHTSLQACEKMERKRRSVRERGSGKVEVTKNRGRWNDEKKRDKRKIRQKDSGRWQENILKSKVREANKLKDRVQDGLSQTADTKSTRLREQDTITHLQ